MQRLFNEFVTLFVVLDPFSTLPVFLALSRRLDAAQARLLAIRGVLIAGAVLLFFVVAGQALLQAMGIPLSSFQLAGSAVLFLMGLKMIFGELHAPGHVGATEPEHDPAVFPLAIPTIAGPGTMLTVVLLTDRTHHSIVDQVETVIEIAVVLLLTLAILFAARLIVRFVGSAGVNVIGRVMGLVLASLAVHNAVLALQALQLGFRT